MGCTISTDIEDTSPMDIEELLEKFDNDYEFVNEIITESLKEFVLHLEIIKSGNADSIRSSAHTIKGCSANMECSRLCDAATNLEKHMKRQNATVDETSLRLTQNVSVETDKVVKYVKNNTNKFKK